MASSVPLIIVVDDQRRFAPNTYWYADGRTNVEYYTTSAAAWQRLFPDEGNAPEINELWLDHDLGGEDTTMKIVDQLEWLAVDDRKPLIRNVVIHTMNPVAQERMRHALFKWYQVHMLQPGDYQLVVLDESFEG